MRNLILTWIGTDMLLIYTFLVSCLASRRA